MKRLRKILFWCHLTVGLTIAVIVIMLSVTGVLLTYERQLVAWADTRDMDASAPEAGMARLGAGELLAMLAASEGALPGSVTWQADSEKPATVSYGREKTLYVNAYTGAVLGGAKPDLRAFFESVEHWHRWMAAEGEGRETFKAIVDGANLGFLFLVLSGLWLWWPKNWRKNTVRAVTWFRAGLSPKARDFNWHHVIGFWSLIPLFIIVVSGVVIAYPWASNLVYTLNGEEPPVRRAPPGPPPAPRPDGGTGEQAAAAPFHMEEASYRDLNVLLAPAERRMPAWRTLTLNVPSASDETIRLSLNAGTGGQPQMQAQMEIDRATGSEVSYRGFEAGTSGGKWRAILRFAHTGEVLGFWGQTLAGLVTLGTILLAYTGAALSLRRFAAWRRRRAEAARRAVAAE
ncbi:MAG: PepSY-associated TM helix domain-containing protein [Rhodothermales bacterium]